MSQNFTQFPCTRLAVEHFTDEQMSALDTYYLYADVTAWRYTCDHLPPGNTKRSSATRVHLDATLELCILFDEKSPLLLCLTDNHGDPDTLLLLSPWQLNLIPASDDPPVPRILEAVLTMKDEALAEVKRCLFLTAQSSACRLLLTLAVQEIPAIDDAERSFAIVEFSHVLHHETCTNG